MDIASYIDHTLLKPTTLLSDVKELCEQAVTYKFAAVCVPPPFVKQSHSALYKTPVKVATVIGFPFGYSISRAKVFETQQALQDGADELDLVINLIALKSGAWNYLETEVKHILEAVHKNEKVLKVIIESGVLTDAEIIKCCELYGGLGVDFLKTSTGYAEKGASVEAVQLMRKHLPPSVRIKASGGIRTYEFASELIKAGADRIGASASVAIVKGDPGSSSGY